MLSVLCTLKMFLYKISAHARTHTHKPTHTHKTAVAIYFPLSQSAIADGFAPLKAICYHYLSFGLNTISQDLTTLVIIYLVFISKQQ